MFQPQRGGMFIVHSQRDAKLRQERHVSATCRPAGAFGLMRSPAINMALLTELCRALLLVPRSSLIQWQCTPAPLVGEGEHVAQKRHRSLVFLWSLVIGHWTLVIGHWSLVIRNFTAHDPRHAPPP